MHVSKECPLINYFDFILASNLLCHSWSQFECFNTLNQYLEKQETVTYPFIKAQRLKKSLRTIIDILKISTENLNK